MSYNYDEKFETINHVQMIKGGINYDFAAFQVYFPSYVEINAIVLLFGRESKDGNFLHIDTESVNVETVFAK